MAVINNMKIDSLGDRFEQGELDAEQQAFVDKYFSKDDIPMLRHPLYIEMMFMPCLGSVKHAMKAVSYKHQMIKKLAKEKNYSMYVFTFERPFRLEAFLHVCRNIDDPKIYWELLTDLWSDSESPCFYDTNRMMWAMLWKGNDGKFDALAIPVLPTDEEDVERYKSLPQTLTVYRGGNAGGYSWTLSRRKAHFFAERNRIERGDNYELWSLDIDKSEIAWYTDARNEQEVIIIDHKNEPKALN